MSTERASERFTQKGALHAVAQPPMQVPKGVVVIQETGSQVHTALHGEGLAYERAELFKSSRPTGAAFWVACKDAAPALGTAVIILGGIEFGIVTPTEAGVLAVVYTLFLGVADYRVLDRAVLQGVLIRASKTKAIAVSVLAPASVFSWIMARESLPDLLTRGIKHITSTPLGVHLLIIGALLILGMFMEATSVLIIVMPFLFPVAMKAGLDPIHFGICSTVALVIGLVTPPVGMLLFLACTIGKTTVKATLRTLYPQIAIMIFVLLLIVLFPPLTTFFPRWLLGL